jgi:two-component system, cell cycle sensor histidine kinase and response regulator CckA
MQNIRARCKDGTLHPVTIALSPVSLDDQRVVIASIRDNASAVAARAREQEMYVRLLRTQRLEDIGMMSCGIAHDFRNLLNIILGNAELALRDVDTCVPAQRAYMEAIRGSAAHLQELSNQLLNYAVGGSTTLRAVHLHDAVAEMSALLRISLPASTRLRCVTSAGLPPVFAEPSHVAQILLNLILNANDAIGTSAGNITVRTGFDNGHVFVEVEDDGCGIAPEARARVLDTFYSTKEGGKGLGLAVVNGIVERYGGKLVMTSREGVGSVFKVMLPASRAGSS